MNGCEEKRYSYRYPRPAVTVDTLVFALSAEKKWQVLLIKRKSDPFGGWWALPGGFVDMEEDLLTAARRELWEEAHLQPVYLGQLQTYGAVARDPRGRTISVAYLAIAKEGQTEAYAGDDAKEAAWFDVDLQVTKAADGYQVQLALHAGQTALSAQLSLVFAADSETGLYRWEMLCNNGLAFDHGEIIADGVLALKERLLTSGGLSALLPPEFTLAQVRRVYEAVQGQAMSEEDFRCKVQELLEATGCYQDGAALYRFRSSVSGDIDKKGV